MRHTIGEHGAWILTRLVRKRSACRRESGVGNDPTAAKHQGITVGEASVDFLVHVKAKRAEGTYREYKGHLDNYILPKFKNHALAKLTIADVESLHLKIGGEGHLRWLH